MTEDYVSNEAIVEWLDWALTLKLDWTSFKKLRDQE